MNIKILTTVEAGLVTYQAGDMATLPDREALPLIKCGAASPGDRRAQQLVEEADAAEQVASELAAAAAKLNNPDKRPRDSGGFLVKIQARTLNWHSNKPARGADSSTTE